MLTRSFILPDLSIRSPRKLVVVTIKHSIIGSKYSNKMLFAFENKTTAGDAEGECVPEDWEDAFVLD